MQITLAFGVVMMKISQYHQKHFERCSIIDFETMIIADISVLREHQNGYEKTLRVISQE